MIENTLNTIASLLEKVIIYLKDFVYGMFSTGGGDIFFLVLAMIGAYFFDTWREFGWRKWIPMGLITFLAIKFAGSG